MRCKCCNAVMGTTETTKKRLDPNCMDSNFDEEEDLCNKCLSVAKDAYLFYNEEDHEVRDEDTRKHFQTNADSYDDLYNIKAEIGSHGAIRTEGL